MAETDPANPDESTDEPQTDPKTLGEKLAAMIEAEAEAAEEDTEEESTEEEPEPEPEPEPDPLTLALVEYIGKVSTILGPEVPIHPCPYCQGKGFEPMIFAKDPNSHVCEECNGYGRVATGSYVAGNEVRACGNCNGWGYVPDKPTLTAVETAEGSEAVKVLTPEEVAMIAADARRLAGVENA